VPERTVPALAPDAVVLHIGPHKTGTTAIQTALYDARKIVREHGTQYAGPGRQPYLAALYATGHLGRRGDPTPEARHWKALIREVGRASGRRVVISSERFATATDEAIPRILDDLGRDRVHVIVTLRPLAKILPSQWQQYVQNGLRLTYSEWLDHVFEGQPYTQPTPDFWVRHSHGELVRRWADAVGVDNITVIVVDDEDHTMLTRSFEALLALPDGLLVPERTNRSLTLGETEIIRLLNGEHASRGWSNGDYRQFIRKGATIEMKRRVPDAAEFAIDTPMWAAERAAAASAAAAKEVASLGVRVMGDLDQLTRLPSATTTESLAERPAPDVPAAAAAAGIVGAITAGLDARSTFELEAAALTPEEQADALRTVGTKVLARTLADRTRERARAAVGRARKR
jgi:hypothetical protein